MTPNQPLFLAEIVDDTLILVPAGSHIGYRLSRVEQETDRILAKLAESGVANVLVDAGQLEYLGTAVIGALVRVWEAMRERSGQFVLCNLSDDVLTALIVTNLDTRWPHFATRDAALATLRNDPVLDLAA